MSESLEQKIRLKIEELIPHLKKGAEDGGEASAGRTWTHREEGYEFDVTLTINATRLSGG